MTLFRLQAAVGFLCLILPSLAFPIGDSAGGCSPATWTEAAIVGTPAQLAAVIERVTEDRRKSKKRRWFSLPTVVESLEQVRRQVINAPYDCNAPQGVRLLDIAAAAGNLANVDYLLKAGADPNARDKDKGGQTIFMRCVDLTDDRRSPSWFWNNNRTPEQIAGKLAAYAHILEHGGDINARTSNNETALHLCNDPALIALYLRTGARGSTASVGSPHNPGTTTPLDYRTYQVVTTTFPGKVQTLAITKLLAASADDRAVSQITQLSICYNCSGVEVVHECRALSTILTVKDRRIFKSKGYTTNENSRSFRCMALMEPDCTDCSWRKHYQLTEE